MSFKLFEQSVEKLKFKFSNEGRRRANRLKHLHEIVPEIVEEIFVRKTERPTEFVGVIFKDFYEPRIEWLVYNNIRCTTTYYVPEDFAYFKMINQFPDKGSAMFYKLAWGGTYMHNDGKL